MKIVAATLVLIASVSLYVTWLTIHFHDLTATQDGWIRFVLGNLLALLILLRPKPAGAERQHAIMPLLVLAGPGILFYGAGTILPVHQMQWLGFLLLITAGLRWGLPSRYGRDTLLAMLLAYWIHPLPAQVFVPLQEGMQILSVRGGEWWLHLFNVRVWADGFVLRTGVQVYEIPTACGGLRAATTVFLLALGLSILRRFRWYSAAGIVLLTLSQALLLNIIRIAIMVMTGVRVDEQGTAAFLHDTTGILTLMAILLTVLEIAAWDRWRQKRRQHPEDAWTGHTWMELLIPDFWQRIWRTRWSGLALLLVVLLTAGIVFRSRPYHRATMIKVVAERLRDHRDIESALRAARAVSELVPEDTDWNLIRIQMLLIAGHHAEVIQALDRFESQSDTQPLERRVLRAYASLGLNRVEDAARLVAGLPETLRKDPRVAMIFAEIAYRANDPGTVGTNVVLAAQWYPNLPKARAMFPFLERYRQWSAIAAADYRLPYTDPETILAAIAARMNLDHLPEVADLTRQFLADWPKDPRGLIPLFYLAKKQPGSRWEDLLALHFAWYVQLQKSPDRLYELFPKCFQVGRPDLAWITYWQLQAIDPGHPGLPLAAAVFGEDWFTFRTQAIRLPGKFSWETIDLTPHFNAIRRISRPAWYRLQAAIPLAEELLPCEPAARMPHLLPKALAAFAARDAEGTLSLGMQYEYCTALQLADRPGEACARLESIRRADPSQSQRVRIALSEIYERQGNWQQVYETLRDYPDTEKDLQATPLLRLCKAQVALRLGLGAIHTAAEAVRCFPDSTRTIGALAAAQASFDGSEEGLLTVSRTRTFQDRTLDSLQAALLFRTERYAEAQRFCRARVLPRLPLHRMGQQAVLPVEAELTLRFHDGLVPAPAILERNAELMQKNLATLTSPYLQQLIPLWLACYRARGEGATSDIDAWQRCGRDPREQAVALQHLMLLSLRNGRMLPALEAARRAVAVLPASPLLWRYYIALSKGSPPVIAAARKACPTDSEIWLAELMAGAQKASGVRQSDDAAARAIRAAATTVAQTPATLTRAGDYYYRRGWLKPACLAAQQAEAHAQGYLPAHVLAVRCALQTTNRDWVLAAVNRAIEADMDPPPLFYEKLVQLRAATDSTDDEMVHALRALRLAAPTNALWAQMQGYARFRRGGLDLPEAMRNFDAALELGSTNLLPYLLGGETARLLGDRNKAVSLLHQGYTRYPGNLILLNNMVYTLAQNPGTVAEALRQLPELLRQGGDNPHVLDTAVAVYLHAGKIVEARAPLNRLTPLVEEGSPAWFRTRVFSAEILFHEGQTAKAIKLMETLLTRVRGVPDEDVVNANRFLDKMRNTLAQPRRGERENDKKIAP